MNIAMIVRVQAALLLMLMAFLVFPLTVAWWHGETVLPFMITLAIASLIGGGGLFVTRNAIGELQPKDGFLIVTLGWLVAVIAGATPFHISGLLGWVDAIFESAAGFTTTGSSVLSDIEAWPQGMLFWRSLTQWLGGMGMLLLAVAILPFLGVGGIQIMKAEVPGPSKDRLTPRLVSTARILWVIYFGYTVVAMVAYHLSGLGWLEALHHAMTTLSTGGFSTRNTSMTNFSPSTQWIAVVFMALGGVNFLIHFHLLVRRDFSLLKTSEFQVYMGLIFGASLVIAWNRMTYSVPMEQAMREAFFQVVSIMTTTGYATVDYGTWSFLMQAILGGLMVIGGMSGSTAGGGKVIRIIVLVKTVAVVCRRLINPFRIVHLKVGVESVSRDLVEACVAMFFLSMVFVFGSMVMLHLMGMDPLSALGAALTSLSNVGPGFGTVGPASNFAAIPDGGKLLLSLLMVVGRLEIYTVLLLFTVGFWRS